MKKQLFFSIFLFITVIKVLAQPGTLDVSFNSSDVGFANGDGANSIILTHTIQNDSKIIIGGQFTYFNGTAKNYITRLNADGTLDNNFISGVGTNGYVHATAVQGDGKIIIAGNFTSYNGTAQNRIVRLNPNGTLDSTFNVGTGTDGVVYTVAIQTNGKIIIGGFFTSYNGNSVAGLARLNLDGSFDNTFNMGSGADNPIYSTIIQPDGKIIIGGQFSSYNGVSRNKIARLNIDGTLDVSFNPGTGANNIVRTICRQTNGQLVIGGDFTSFNGITKNYITRLNTDGNLDNSFNTGTGPNNIIRSISVQSNGQLIIGGDYTTFNSINIRFISRLSSNGTLDTSFNQGPMGLGAIYTTSLQSNDKIIIGGDLTTYNTTNRSKITRLNSDGSIDFSFNPGTGAGDAVRAVKVQSDGKIIIGGDFTSYNGSKRNGISRINTDGSNDTSFNPGLGVYNTNCGVSSNFFCRYEVVSAIAIQSNGKIIIGGSFGVYNGQTNLNTYTYLNLVRLNADGTLDNSFFTSPSFFTGNVYCITIQSDGKIIIGGSFNYRMNSGGVTKRYILRLNADGTEDISFNTGTGPDAKIYSIAIQNDGKILVGGQFANYNGVAKSRLLRLLPDGTLDSFFNLSGAGINNINFDPPGNNNTWVRTIAIQNDGKIIIGGKFSSYNGTNCNNLARLNANGSIDNSFNVGNGANGNVYTISTQSDGKIIIGGIFSSYNGNLSNSIARINFDGQYDNSFIVGTGFNGNTIPFTVPVDYSEIQAVLSSYIQSDGKIIIGGKFTSYNGIGRNRIARINEGTALTNSDFEKDIILIYPNPTKNTFRIEIEKEFKGFLVDITGKLLMEVSTKDINISHLSPGIYFLNISIEGKQYSKKIIKE